MNHENVRQALLGMQEVLSNEKRIGRSLVFMSGWQNVILSRSLAASLEDMITETSCGTAACLAGHLPLMPYFKKLGVTQVGAGAPEYGRRWGVSAVSDLFEISFEEANTLCGLGLEIGEESTNMFYGKPLTEVTSQDVIDKLEILLETGSIVSVPPSSLV